MDTAAMMVIIALQFTALLYVVSIPDQINSIVEGWLKRYRYCAIVLILLMYIFIRIDSALFFPHLMPNDWPLLSKLVEWTLSLLS